MKDLGRLLWLSVGVMAGAVGVGLYLGHAKPALAANDRFEDYIMCTGAATTTQAKDPQKGGK